MELIKFIFLFLFTGIISSVVLVKADCDPGCGVPYGTGICLANGQCLCNFGWTGPLNAISSYVTSGKGVGQIITNGSCTVPCNYNKNFQNFLCARLSPRCDLSCQSPTGGCLANGRCLCRFGWTGPSGSFPVYVNLGPNAGQIVTSSNCTVPCDYNPVFKNTACAQILSDA